MRIVAALTLALNLAEYVLAWLGVFYGWLLPVFDFLPSNSPLAFLQPVRLGLVLPTLLKAHLGLIAALIVSRAVAYLAPDVVPVSRGFVFRSVLGERFVPVDAVRAIRSVELPNERFLVWFESRKGLPLQHLLCWLLLGRWSRGGFFLLSDLQGFEQVAGTIVEQLRRSLGEETWHDNYHEEKPTALVTMLVNPTGHLKAMAEQNPTTQREALWQMLSVAGSLAVPLLVGSFIHWQFPWAALVVPLVAMGEWIFGSAFLFALSEGYVHRLSFDEALRIYPLTQLPRWLTALALTVLIAAGWHWLLFLPALIPAVAYSGMLVVRLSEALFRLEFPASVIGGLVTVIYQIIVYGLFLALLPR